MTGRCYRSPGPDPRRGPPRGGVPSWVALLALFAFGLRGLIPVGFEPADGSLAVVLCHQGFPAQFFAHGKPAPHTGGTDRDSHCLFCSAGGSAPSSPLPTVAYRAPVAIGLVSFSQPSLQTVRLAHVPQARAPPELT